MERGYSGDEEAPSTDLGSHHSNVRGRSAASQYSSMEATGQNLAPNNPPFHGALKFLVLLMLALVALKYAGKAHGLFEENPVPAWCFLGAAFAYSLVLGIMKQMTTSQINGTWFQILNRAAMALSLVLSVSLLSIFLPHPISFKTRLILTPLSVVVLAWPILRPAYNWVSQIHARVIIHMIWYWLYTNIVDNIRAKVVCCARGCSFTREESLSN